MEKVLTILGVIVLLMIIYLLFSKRAKRFILKFLNYKILIIKGTTNFINKYREIFGLECFSYKEIDRFNWLFCNLNNEETK